MPLIGFLLEELVVTQVVKTSSVFMEQRLAFSSASH
jgi:hypothetical protein